MLFCGEELFELGQAKLWARLTDMQFVSGTIPDVDKVVRVDPAGFAVKVRPKFSFLTGSLELTFEILESTPQQRLVVRSRGKGIGAAVAVDAEIHLAAAENGTQLKWTGNIVSREGLLKPLGESLLQATAQRVIESFWHKFRAALNA